MCSGLSAFDPVPHKHSVSTMRVHKATKTWCISLKGVAWDYE